MTREGFEAWATNHHPWILADAKWHEYERRYTVMSSAQVLWEAWQAAAKLQREKDAGGLCDDGPLHWCRLRRRDLGARSGMMSRYDKGKEGLGGGYYGSPLSSPVIVVKKRKKGEPVKEVTAKQPEAQDAIGFGCSRTKPVRYE